MEEKGLTFGEDCIIKTPFIKTKYQLILMK